MEKLIKILWFPIWWYKFGFEWFKRVFKNLVIFINNKLAVSLMLKLILVPLFHDTTIVGRLLSFIFRFFRVIYGSLALTLVSLSGLVWMLTWFLLPIILYEFRLGGLIVLGWLIWAIKVLLTPEKTSRQVYKLLKKSKNNSQKLLELLLENREVKQILQRIELSHDNFSKIPLILIMDYWLKLAKKEARLEQKERINSLDLILALLKVENWRYEDAKEARIWLKKQACWKSPKFIWDKEYKPRPMGGINRSWTGIPTPTLDKYSSDLTKKAQKAQMSEILGKEAELTKMAEVLSRKQRNNVLVIGEPGSGKTSLVKGMAQEIVRGVKFKHLRFKRLISLEPAKLSANANSAELSHRITKIVEEVKQSQNIILFVDELHNLAVLNQDQPETSNLLMALEPILNEGHFQFIGTTSQENYKKYLEPNEAFTRSLELVELPEADQKETLEILEYEAFKQEQTEKVIITVLGLKTIIETSDKLITDRVRPDKAVNLLDETVSAVGLKNKTVVNKSEVLTVVSQKTKVPLSQLSDQEKELLLNLEKKLHQRVIGQDKAIKAIANAVRRDRTQLKDETKPIASFMFSGPTGVGKTETAKALADEFFGSEKMMIRLDMSEYQAEDSVNRMIGAPPGKPDSATGGQLTEAVRHQPYTLILLDEIEKAHPKIITLFLQVLDEARLTDSQGKVVSFSNSIIIATTNVGTKEQIEKHFAPEFLNRFTGLVEFDKLTSEQTKKVVKLKLNKLIQRLKRQEVEIKFDEKVIDQLTEEGFSHKWGGRQVDRVIQERLMNLIAKQLLTGEIKKQQLTIIDELK